MIMEIELGIIIILLFICDIIFFIHFEDVRKTLRRIENILKNENIIYKSSNKKR